MSRVDVSVIICTRDRAESLRGTLAALGRCEVPAGWRAELLVVDNGSTDETPGVVSAAELPGFDVRLETEPEPGLSRARNAAIAAARGGILLWTDDDVRPPADWIGRMCGPIASGSADAVAGGVRPAGHLERPWLRGDVRGWLACTDAALDSGRPPRLVGANMAFSRRVLERVPHVDVELGAGALGSFEETLFTEQLLEAGYRVRRALDVEVEHHFDESRLAPGAMEAAAVKLGRSWAYVHHHWRHGRVRLPRLRLWAARLSAWTRRRAVRPGDAPDLRLLRDGFRIGIYRGYLAERRRPPNYDRRGLRKTRGVPPRPRELEPAERR